MSIRYLQDMFGLRLLFALQQHSLTIYWYIRKKGRKTGSYIETLVQYHLNLKDLKKKKKKPPIKTSPEKEKKNMGFSFINFWVCFIMRTIDFLVKLLKIFKPKLVISSTRYIYFLIKTGWPWFSVCGSSFCNSLYSVSIWIIKWVIKIKLFSTI